MADGAVESTEVRDDIKGLIFAGYTEGDKDDLLGWDEMDPYIEELCALGVERLRREPDVLTGEYLRIEKQLQDVASSNYRALITSFESSGAVRDGVSRLRVHLDQLLRQVPEFSGTVRQFSSAASEAEAKRQKKLRVLSEHRRTLELLEIPQLMLSLVHSELHDEALELMAFTRKLARSFPDVQRIRHVAEEVERITGVMVNQLLELLRSSYARQLPMCLRVVSYLRRLNLFGEDEIRNLFLQCRGRWMKSMLVATSAPTPQGRLERLSDDTRAMMFEIVTHYIAVFLDDKDGEAGSGTAILHDWVLQIVDQYIGTIEAGLEELNDGASIATVLQQTMYCGLRLGRVGADFRPVLAPMLERAVKRLYTGSLENTLQRFRAMIAEHNWSTRGAGRTEDAPGSGEAASDVFAAPPQILAHTPLAVLTNGILAAHNELRFCCPVVLNKPLSSALEGMLLNCVTTLKDWGGESGAFLREGEAANFVDMVHVFKDGVAPFSVECLERCLGGRSGVDVARISAEADVLLGAA